MCTNYYFAWYVLNVICSKNFVINSFKNTLCIPYKAYLLINFVYVFIRFAINIYLNPFGELFF